MGGCSQVPKSFSCYLGVSEGPDPCLGEQEEWRLFWNLGYLSRAPKVWYTATAGWICFHICAFPFSAL